MSAVIIDPYKPEQKWRVRTAIFARLKLYDLGASAAQADEIIKQMLALATDMPAAIANEATALDWYQRVVTGVAESIWRRQYQQPQANTTLSTEGLVS
jgi:hypothetical protein